MRRKNLESELKKYIRSMRNKPRTKQNRLVILGLVMNLRALRASK